MQQRSQRSNGQYGFENSYDLKRCNNDLAKQLIELVKENKKLMIQLDTAKAIIDEIKISKAKYKDKYKRIKKQLQQERHKNHCPKVRLHRQKSGQIYRQGRSSKSQEQQKMNIIRPTILPRFPCINLPTVVKNITQQNPYGISNQVKLMQLTKISAGVEHMSQILKQITSGSQQNQKQFMQFIKKMGEIEKRLGEQVSQIKQYVSSFKLSKQSSFNIVSFNHQQRRKSYSNLQNMENNSQTETKNKLARQKLNCEESFEEVKKNRSQKLRKSKSHDSFNEIRIRGSEQKGRKERQKEGSQSQSTKSKWQMLNFIGKRLENFKFQKYDSQSDLLEHSDERERNKAE